MMRLTTPLSVEAIDRLHVGDMILLSGDIFCGRDAVLPKVVRSVAAGDDEFGLVGGVVFHTAVSPAGVGPTSSNKLEIEQSMVPLSRAGVRMHLGKGMIRRETIEALCDLHAVFAVIAPITALLEKRTLEKSLLAFPELGMEALYKLKIVEYPIIIAAAHGESIYG